MREARSRAFGVNRRHVPLVAILVTLLIGTSAGFAQQINSSEIAVAPTTAPSSLTLGPQVPDLTKRENFSGAMQIIVLLTVLSLAPAILIMMTSFTRVVIVLSLLRQ